MKLPRYWHGAEGNERACWFCHSKIMVRGDRPECAVIVGKVIVCETMAKRRKICWYAHFSCAENEWLDASLTDDPFTRVVRRSCTKCSPPKRTYRLLFSQVLDLHQFTVLWCRQAGRLDYRMLPRDVVEKEFARLGLPAIFLAE